MGILGKKTIADGIAEDVTAFVENLNEPVERPLVEQLEIQKKHCYKLEQKIGQLMYDLKSSQDETYFYRKIINFMMEKRYE